MKRKYIIIGLAILAIIGIFYVVQPRKSADPVKKEETAEVAEVKEEKEVISSISQIKKSGNVVLAISGSDLLNEGFEYGDILTVSFNGRSFDMPLCYNYSNVAMGELVCVIDEADNDVTVAGNGIDFTSENQIAKKEKIQEDPGFRWDSLIGDPIEVKIVMGEKEGYKEVLKYMVFNRTNVREDYASLSDEDYANFRNVHTGQLKEGILYRSSSPISPALGRNSYADEACRNAGVRVMIDLQDDEKAAAAYEGFSDTYYASVTDVFVPMGYNFFTDAFRQNVASVMRAIIANEGPYLIHCKEGKDRTGITIAVLECLCGASYDEIIEDYMKTYFNFFDAKLMKEGYDIIVENNIREVLCKSFDTEEPEKADLEKCAHDYLLDCGLSEDEIAALREKLV